MQMQIPDVSGIDFGLKAILEKHSAITVLMM